METTTQEGSMLTYEFRLDFEDGYEIVQEDADNYGSAARRIAEHYPDAESMTFLATIDREPQQYLAATA